MKMKYNDKLTLKILVPDHLRFQPSLNRWQVKTIVSFAVRIHLKKLSSTASWNVSVGII